VRDSSQWKRAASKEIRASSGYPVRRRASLAVAAAGRQRARTVAKAAAVFSA